MIKAGFCLIIFFYWKRLLRLSAGLVMKFASFGRLLHNPRVIAVRKILSCFMQKEQKSCQNLTSYNPDYVNAASRSKFHAKAYYLENPKLVASPPATLRTSGAISHLRWARMKTGLYSFLSSSNHAGIDHIQPFSKPMLAKAHSQMCTMGLGLFRKFCFNLYQLR